ncbi:unnamed protein product [Bursaphelenchus okinawaensis]|uniref:Uncharacterized protein n=1 Tax=Bursaphelenchus okinawaensis TaxID=465554 RepID=A0A811KBB1_9BILA|nr:unnamed protein product [Bursaphelenchus okinawaensis]CAG9098954.1 unnamed protein product [Bursaphelenchus okinawaensis]
MYDWLAVYYSAIWWIVLSFLTLCCSTNKREPPRAKSTNRKLSTNKPIPDEDRWRSKQVRRTDSSSTNRGDEIVKPTRVIRREHSAEELKRTFEKLSQKYRKKRRGPIVDKTLTSTILVEEDEGDFENGDAVKTCATQEQSVKQVRSQKEVKEEESRDYKQEESQQQPSETTCR